MNVRKEINDHAKEEDKPILLWLLSHYSRESKRKFVMYCIFEKYGAYSYHFNRIWKPTIEGKALYEYFNS